MPSFPGFPVESGCGGAPTRALFRRAFLQALGPAPIADTIWAPDLLAGLMIYIVWEFEVTAENRVCFEAAYNGDGVWARLFRRDPAYRQTILVKEFDRPGGYLTIDVWEDQDSYLRFKDRFADDYRKIDEECERLTARERPIGVFEQVPSAIAAHPKSVDRRTE